MLVQRVKASGNGETELHDRLRSGHPATTTSPDMLQSADDIIHADRCIKSRQMAVQLSVINGNATDSARQCPSSHKCEPKRQSPNLVGLCSTIPPIVLIWRRQIFIFLGY
jgi:hypothetical protein